MRVIRGAVIVAVATAVTCGTMGNAIARHVGHHRLAHGFVRHFVFASPEAAAAASGPGALGGTFVTGITGPSTADPYATHAYGYGASGYYGPGFGYPGY